MMLNTLFPGDQYHFIGQRGGVWQNDPLASLIQEGNVGCQLRALGIIQKLSSDVGRKLLEISF